MTSDNIKSGAYLAAIAAAAYVIYTGWKTANKAGDQIAAAATKVGGWINPASDQNLAYQSVNAVGGYFSDDKGWTLGGAIYDVSHPGPAASVGTEDQYDAMGNFIGTFRGGYSAPTGRNGQQKGVTGSW